MKIDPAKVLMLMGALAQVVDFLWRMLGALLLALFLVYLLALGEQQNQPQDAPTVYEKLK